MSISRRKFIGASSLAMAASVAGGSNGLLAAPTAGSLPLTMAGNPYDHVKALMDGVIPIEGCETSFEVDKIGNLNTHAFAGPQTRGVTEIGLGPFILAYANDEFRDYSLLPVFPLRTFRHKSIFVHADAGIDHPSQLKGKRVGTPGYSQTSLQWIRGIMQDEYGVRPEDVEWVVSAKDSASSLSGAVSKNENVFPDNLTVRTGPVGKDESELLLDRDVDALFHALEPRAFVEGNPKIRRLFEDPRATEQDYYKRTGIFPIMHAVAIRNDLVEQYPWLPQAVFNAYSSAKQANYDTMRNGWYFRTLPWYAQELESTREVMGENFFKYGIEPNRKTLEALFRYSHEQGLANRQVTVEELFESSSLSFFEPQA